MGPHSQGAASHGRIVQQTQLKDFDAGGPTAVNQSCNRPETHEQNRPPVQLRGQLAQDKTKASCSCASQDRKQNRQWSAGCHSAAEAKDLSLGVAALTTPAAPLQPGAQPVQNSQWRLRGGHIHHCGSVLAGSSKEKNQPNSKKNCEQES